MTRPIGAAVGDAAAAGRQPPEPHNIAQHFCACSTSDPSLFTPSGWYRCGNLTSPLVDDWEELLEAAAEAVRPFIANGTVVGIFYGDEISCTCNVPFWAVDAATAYFR